MNTADALLICQVAPGQRRLRVSHFPEASTGLTALVSCGVASFFLLYFGLLLLFFTVRPSLKPSSASFMQAVLGFCKFHTRLLPSMAPYCQSPLPRNPLQSAHICNQNAPSTVQGLIWGRPSAMRPPSAAPPAVRRRCSCSPS